MKQPIISDGNIKPEWDRAAMELSGKVHMGKVFSKDLARQSSVKYFPTIIYFPAGDKSEQNSIENYEGDIKANDIVTWALQVVVCQKDLFFHQLSQNWTADCSSDLPLFAQIVLGSGIQIPTRADKIVSL